MIIGFSIGIGDVTCTMYIGEVSSKKVRGSFYSLITILYNLGNVIEYTLGAYAAYRTSLVFPLAISVLFLISCSDLVESPHFLIERNDRLRALKITAWLRDSDTKDAEKELAEIRDNLREKTNFREFFENFRKPEVYKSYCVVTILGSISAAFNVTIGTNSNLILPAWSVVSSDQFAIIFSSFATLAVTSSFVLLQKFGRRTSLLCTHCVQLFLNGFIALLFYTQQQRILSIPNFPWLVFALVTTGFFIFMTGALVQTAVLRTELFPPNFKNFGINSAMVTNATTNFALTFLFLKIGRHVGMYLNFLIFSACNLTAIVVVYCVLPETGGKTLAEIQTALRGRTSRQREVQRTGTRSASVAGTV